MNYTLMHKNVAVMDMEIDEVSGAILKASPPYAAEHIPLGIAVMGGYVERSDLNYWWQERAIPASRSGIREALEELNIYSPQLLLTKCLGLSLSDQYWVRPLGSDLIWEQVNFFDHPFSDDIGDVLLGKRSLTRDFDFSSPDNTSNGNLKKRWKIIDGTRYLIKGGSGTVQQEPFNEVIAAAVMKRLGIDHVPYRLYWDGNTPYSLCADFITRDTELVSAWNVMKTRKQRNETSSYQHYCNCCAALGIDIVPFLDRMIVADYIIANEDRHFGNFGLIRKADTLEWVGAAPIYDSGSSLGFNQTTAEIKIGSAIKSRPFKTRPEEQLALVSSVGWLDLKALDGIADEIMGIFSGAELRIDRSRQTAIISAMEMRMKRLETFVQDRTYPRSFQMQIARATETADMLNVARGTLPPQKDKSR